MGLLMGGTEKGTMSSMPVNRAAHDFMKDVDFALVGGFGYYLNDTFNAGLRANWGMTNRVLHFYIGYTLKHN
jgi:hypothetical protein